MAQNLILVAIVLFLCLMAEKLSGKVGMPALILFMGVGMLFGSDGILRIAFDDYGLAQNICLIALCFIMFYGGFNMKWSAARPVAVKAICLSTIGVVVTAGLTAVFCLVVLKFDFVDAFLMGAVLSSTDAASVFSVLRTKKLNLKDGTASILEMESGSNDPVAYLLTMIGIMMKTGGSLSSLPYMIFAQVVFGLAIGAAAASLGILLLKKGTMQAAGMDMILVIALVMIAFGLSEAIGGNAFLTVYLMGILLGNSNIRGKETLIPFFDGMTGLAQIVLFFLLGLLSFPHKLPQIFFVSLAIAIVLTVIIRPATVFLIMKPFKCRSRQCLMISWAGLRGAASIVFAIMVIAASSSSSDTLFHTVFMVALLSVAIQGTLLPFVAEKLKMVDDNCDVRMTFNDYKEASEITMMQMEIPEGHNWENRLVKDVSMPTGSLAVMIKRHGETLIPGGDTRILAGDTIVLSVPAYESGGQEHLEEQEITPKHRWCNKTIAELMLPHGTLIVLVRRDNENIIPNGQTEILEGDHVVIYR